MKHMIWAISNCVHRLKPGLHDEVHIRVQHLYHVTCSRASFIRVKQSDVESPIKLGFGLVYDRDFGMGPFFRPNTYIFFRLRSKIWTDKVRPSR